VPRLVCLSTGAQPGIRIDLSLNDRQIDLVEEGVDLVVRLGRLPDSSLVARKLGDARRVLVASSAYLAARGEPACPQDLLAHNGIRFARLAGSDTLHLTAPSGETEQVTFQGNFQADHALAVREALLAGHGLGPAHYWLVADLLEAGRLQVILPDHRLEPVPLHLLMVRGRGKRTRVRLLIEFMVEAMAGVPE
jgi:DNA-binding transcriptional LysR family regulator